MCVLPVWFAQFISSSLKVVILDYLAARLSQLSVSSACHPFLSHSPMKRAIYHTQWKRFKKGDDNMHKKLDEVGVRAKLAGSVQAADKARAAAEDTVLLIL